MGVIEDINKLHPTLRSLLIGIGFILPFWYVDIYLFNTQLFVSVPFYLPIAFAFCFSILWIGLNILLILTFFEMLFKVPYEIFEDNKKDTKDSFPFVVVYSLITLCVFTLIGYVYGSSLFGFLELCFFAVISQMIIWILIRALYESKKKKNKK